MSLTRCGFSQSRQAGPRRRGQYVHEGLLDTKTFLKSVLDKEVGLRTGNTLSHVAVFEVKGIEQLLFLTDVAFMTYPTLEDKVHIIENTVAVAHACGVECPKVAPLAAVEVVNPKMPCTVDADELRKMNAEGKITGCVVDGPLSMDIAIDPEAAHHKGAQDRPPPAMRISCCSPTSRRATSSTRRWSTPPTARTAAS